ncbi:MAG: hypothetical protein GTN99_02875 [Candidatus Dadabacteria bacterium]|nr:hypothetical protein [Candidatus Dadabacteria bacterium]
MPTAPIQAGSHSRLSVFEACPRRALYQFVEKIPEPDRGEPPAKFKGEWPDERGKRVHIETEEFVKGERKELTKEMRHFEDELVAARTLYSKGNVICEQMWCFDNDWQPLPWNDDDPDKWRVFNNIAFRIKTDNTTFLSSTRAIIVDYKTGKMWGNEVKHAEQLELYGIGAFIKFPQLEEVIAELWYFDVNDLKRQVFTKQEAYRMLKSWDERNKNMTSCTSFPPKPSLHTCRYCPFGPMKSGHCKEGIQEC